MVVLVVLTQRGAAGSLAHAMKEETHGQEEQGYDLDLELPQ